MALRREWYYWRAHGRRRPKRKVKPNKNLIQLRSIVNVLVREGHREHDVLWIYSIEKCKRYFEDILEQRMDDRFALTNIIGTAVYAFGTDPPTSGAASKRQSAWKKLLDFYDPQKVKGKVRDRKNPLKSLATAGIPIFAPTKDEDDKESDG